MFFKNKLKKQLSKQLTFVFKNKKTKKLFFKTVNKQALSILHNLGLLWKFVFKVALFILRSHNCLERNLGEILKTIIG